MFVGIVEIWIVYKTVVTNKKNKFNFVEISTIQSINKLLVFKHLVVVLGHSIFCYFPCVWVMCETGVSKWLYYQF